MVFDFNSALVWVQGIGLAALLVVAIGFALKKAGVIDSIWGLISKFVDWIMSAFNAMIFSAPAFVRVGIFLVLFSLAGAVIVPLTFGVYGVCDSDGDLWKTEDFFEGFSAQTLPGGLLTPVTTKALAVGDGAEFYMSDARLPVATIDEGGILAVDDDETSWYAVCRSNTNGVCYVKRVTEWASGGGENACSSIAEVESTVTGDYVTLLTYYYYDVEDNEEFYSIGPERKYVHKGILQNGGLTSWNSVSDCTESGMTSDEMSNSVLVSVYEPRSVTNLITFGLVGDPQMNYTGYVVGVATQIAAPEEMVSANRFSGLRVKDKFLSREGTGFVHMPDGDVSGDTITYECEDGEKSVLVFGMDVFNPVSMLLIVVVGGLLVLLFKLNGR